MDNFFKNTRWQPALIFLLITGSLSVTFINIMEKIMNFISRLKKELTEGIVKSLLVDAGYRVIDFGIESQVREVECMTVSEYLNLALPKSLRVMPDLFVMDKLQTTKYLVEVKYRQGWTVDVFNEIEEQVKTLEEVVLIYVNGKPPEDRKKLQSPSLNIRCCKLRHSNGDYIFQCANGDWQKVNTLRQDDNQWWGMNLIQNVFPLFHERASEQTIAKAVGAIKHILHENA